MDLEYLVELFGIEGKVAAITGGGGVLCGVMARAMGRLGAKVAVLDISREAAGNVAAEISAGGGDAIAIECDVLRRPSIEGAAQEVVRVYGRVDILINGAGGNRAEATTSSEQTFFDLAPHDIERVFDLNSLGTILPCQVFGKLMAQQDEGVILNVSSVNAFRPLTRIPAYSSAKAAVSNFTRWLAVHMAQEYSPGIRVNAIAPGFLLTEQNRFLLTDEASGELTSRGRSIIEHTPMRRFGDPEELVATVLWLVSEGAKFVTGVVVPVDGGFSAFSGV